MRAVVGMVCGALAVWALGCASEGGPTFPQNHAAPGDGKSRLPQPTLPAPAGSPAKAGATLVEPRGEEPTREAVPTGEDDLVRGRSSVVVNAPLEKVRAVVQDYGKYAEFMPHYSASRVLGRKPDGTTEVYMQVAALNGLVKMGARVEMPGKPVDDGGYQLYGSKFIDGNVENFVAMWRMKPIDEGHTVLSLEVFLLPKIPMPTGLLNGENTSGAVKGVVAMKQRIEAQAASSGQRF